MRLRPYAVISRRKERIVSIKPLAFFGRFCCNTPRLPARQILELDLDVESPAQLRFLRPLLKSPSLALH